MSNKEQAQNLALETLSEIYKDSSSVSSILRRCDTISALLGKENEQEWIRRELSGFHENITLGELEKIIPEYRKTKALFKNQYGRTFVITKYPDLHEHMVTESIPEIESLGDLDLALTGEKVEKLKELGINIAHLEVPNMYLKDILAQVKNRALEFINKVLKETNGVKRTLEDQDKAGIIFNQQTEDSRLLLYTLENKLRQFVSSKIQENKGKIDEAFIKAWESAKKKEFLPPRKPLESDLINYSTFDQLKKLIVQNENWSKIFRKYFGRPEGVISRINELDEIRDTIAHNRIISDFDYESLKSLNSLILRCIE